MKKYLIDFGGVLYDIDIDRTIEGFRERSELKDFDGRLRSGGNRLVMLYEKGQINSAEFREAVRESLKLKIDDSLFDRIWNSTLIRKKSGIEQVVEKLKKHTQIYLLSNTNEIHFNHFNPECQELFSLFDRCFFSYKIGFVKPEPGIFKYVLNDLQAEPSELVLLDDNESNLAAAADAGIEPRLMSDSFGLSDFLHTVNIY